jgi:hypothetical protein
MMNRIDNSGQGIARLGRNEDNYLAHVAAGEMVVPPVITPETRQRLEREMMQVGLDPNEYTVGSEMSINPITGNPEFGFFKKVAKSLKKVVKKIAPVAAIIPGPWQPFAAVYQKGSAALNIAKGKGGIGDLMTVFAGGSQKVFGKDGALQSIKSGGFKNLGGGFKKALTGIGSIDGKFKPFEYGKRMAKQYKDDQKQGYFGLFSGGDQPVDYMGGEGMMDVSYQPSSSDMPSPEEMDFISKNYSIKGESGMLADKDGNLFTPDQVLQQIRGTQTQTSGGLRDFFGGLVSGGGADNVGNYGVLGDLLGGFTDKLGITNYGGDKQENKGGGLGNLGIAGLAGLVGKLAYEEAKKNKGVPLTPLTTMDQLGRYNIAAEIARQKGEEMPSRVEYGLTGEGMPVLEGGKPRQAAMGGAIYNQADGDHNGIMAFAEGGVVEMKDGGKPPINPADFPPKDGQIDGPGTETSDDIPAMLSDGEFVMTAKAVKGAGSFDMNTNNGIVTLTPNGDPSRDGGTRVMYKLMEHFGSMA